MKRTRPIIPIGQKIFFTIGIVFMMYANYIENLYTQVLWAFLIILVFIDGKIEYVINYITLFNHDKSGQVFGIIRDFKGGIDASKNILYPEALKGEGYIVTKTGTIGGLPRVGGDCIVCIKDTESGVDSEVGDNWLIGKM